MVAKTTGSGAGSGRSRRWLLVCLAAAAALAVVLFVILPRLGRKDRTTEPPAETAQAPTAGAATGKRGAAPISRPAPGQAPAVASEPLAAFAEVVFEVSPRPLSAGEDGDVSEEPTIDGFVFRRTGPTLPGTLYPARGKADSGKAPVVLWVGTRVVSHLAYPPAVSRQLMPAQGKSHDVAPKDAADAAGPFSPLIPPSPLKLALADGGSLSATLGDRKRLLHSGETAVVSSAEKQVDLDRMTDALVALLKDADGPAPDRAAARAELSDLFGAAAPRLYTRLSVTYHGRVRVSRFDLLERLRTARRTADEGPYERAEEALEVILAASPDHPEANELLDRVTRLLDEGREPGRLTGTLAFPDGMPTDKHKALWRQTHSGFAALARPDQREATAMKGASVEDGRFSLNVPQGAYRLTVLVPGFASSEQMVEVKDRTTLSIPLKP